MKDKIILEKILKYIEEINQFIKGYGNFLVLN